MTARARKPRGEGNLTRAAKNFIQERPKDQSVFDTEEALDFCSHLRWLPMATCPITQVGFECYVVDERDNVFHVERVKAKTKYMKFDTVWQVKRGLKYAARGLESRALGWLPIIKRRFEE